MNVERIKNIVLLCLFCSFIVLGGLVLTSDDRHYAQVSQVNAAISLLNANGILVYANIEQDFSDRPNLEINPSEYDLDAIAERFFVGEPYSYEATQTHKVFESDSGSRRFIFSILDNSFIFEIPGGAMGNMPPNQQMNAYLAHNLARSYFAELLGIPDSFNFHSNSLSFRGDYLLTYFGDYRGYRLYNNQLRIRVTDFGIENIFYSYARVEGLSSQEFPIFSPDETLLALLNHFRQNGILDNNIILAEMQLMHFIVDGVAVPSYVFTLFINEIQFNFIFNANTNRFLHYEAIR